MTNLFAGLILTIAGICEIQSRRVDSIPTRTALRSLAIAIAFSPGGMVAGHGGFPMIAWYALAHHLAHLDPALIVLNVGAIACGFLVVQEILKRRKGSFNAEA